jgi:L-fucose mutarotase/ribose pyranase (RbsD/FucU family)
MPRGTHALRLPCILPEDVSLQPLGRFALYDTARSGVPAQIIATGEQRIHAYVLLTIDAAKPDWE